MVSQVVKASVRSVKSTPRKLNLVAHLVRNKKVSFAKAQLMFCKKKAAGFIAKILNSAISSAQYNYGMEIDNLYIKNILIGKSLTLRRVNPRAMGKGNRLNKCYSNIYIELMEEDK
ncbi:50S ribosomal protein L22 [Wolbachia endosymbiont of Pentidionis agamae]|uniref:50S ribosomal protein L22 n=1 Tax=Wolbachia endosymbiont of Pentidionis agamae TaxID=3110435 RepID=UPI002FD4BE05